MSLTWGHSFSYLTLCDMTVVGLVYWPGAVNVTSVTSCNAGRHDPTSNNCAAGSECGSIGPRYQAILSAKMSTNFPHASAKPAVPSPAVSSVTVFVASREPDCGCSLLGPATNESYTLELVGSSVDVHAATIFGARAGLETLAQMVADHPGRVRRFRDAP